jgi:hypothetical protein
LVDEHLLEPRDVAALEFPVDPVVTSTAAHERVHHGRDRLETSEPLIERRHLDHPFLVVPHRIPILLLADSANRQMRPVAADRRRTTCPV